ncbi:MAG: hypothetical protein IJV67_02625 [Clostridia bacterium]|nr:hypothetical protein [Clostridia bacterium]
MKKYNVECAEVNESMIAGCEPWNEIRDNYVGDCIEAESAEDAIEMAIDYIIENVEAGELISKTADEVIFESESGDRFGFAFFNAEEV